MLSSSDNSQREALLDQWLAEYLRRRDSGEPFDYREFARAHPDLAEDLRALIETADLVDCMAGPWESTDALKMSEALTFNPLEVNGPPDEPSTQAGPLRRRPRGDETLAFDPLATGRPAGEASLPLEIRSAPLDDLPLLEDEACIFGDYELLEMLGRGGMGVVYKARQISLNRIVALKMILSGEFASESDIRRFYAEAQAAGKLGHAHIVNVYEMDQVDGRHYFTMEYVEGRTLADTIGRRPLGPQRAARYLELIARGVQCAHDHGVLHRDLKPANVIIDERDEPQITDFGLAKDLSQDTHFTASGAAIGTPGYMAPEQAAGRQHEVGMTADVYSLGAILYEMLTGRAPFTGDSVVDIILDVIHKHPLPPRVVHPQCDRELEVVCLKCLHKDPAKRYASAQEVAEEMRRFLEGRPIQARPLGVTRRLGVWVRDVPLVSALLGRRVYHPTPWQVRSQWLAVAVIFLVAVFATAWLLREAPLPPQIRIASGGAGGMYHGVSQVLAAHLQEQTGRTALAVETAGSYANRELLERGDAEIGLLQSDALTSRSLAVATPLYYETVLVVVRNNRGIHTLADLAGKSVALGPSGSGMRNTALTILRHFHIAETELRHSEARFSDLMNDANLDAAFVISGFDNSVLRQLFEQPDLKVLPIVAALEIADTEPSLKATRLIPDQAPDYLRAHLPAEGMQTLKTPAFLTVRSDASPKLVRATLEAIYLGSDLVSQEGLIPLEQAAKWPLLPLHPTAAEFFRDARTP